MTTRWPGTLKPITTGEGSGRELMRTFRDSRRVPGWSLKSERIFNGWGFRNFRGNSLTLSAGDILECIGIQGLKPSGVAWPDHRSRPGVLDQD